MAKARKAGGPPVRVALLGAGLGMFLAATVLFNGSELGDEGLPADVQDAAAAPLESGELG